MKWEVRCCCRGDLLGHMELPYDEPRGIQVVFYLSPAPGEYSQIELQWAKFRAAPSHPAYFVLKAHDVPMKDLLSLKHFTPLAKG